MQYAALWKALVSRVMVAGSSLHGKDMKINELRGQLAAERLEKEIAEEKKYAAESVLEGVNVELENWRKMQQKVQGQLDEARERIKTLEADIKTIEQETMDACAEHYQEVLDKLGKHACRYGHQAALDGKGVPEEISDLDPESVPATPEGDLVVDLTEGDHEDAQVEGMEARGERSQTLEDSIRSAAGAEASDSRMPDGETDGP